MLIVHNARGKSSVVVMLSRMPQKQIFRKSGIMGGVEPSQIETTRPSGPCLLDRVREKTRLLHMSVRTEKAYAQWIERFLRFHRDQTGQWQHPNEMGSMEVNRFLTHLAVDKNVAASTQNQAFSALLFLFTRVLEREIKIDAVRAKLPERLPVVLSIDEVRRVLVEVPRGPMRMMAGLMYGAGMRLMECCRLRVKDVGFERRQITVRDGKGEKDRMVPFPERLIDGLRGQIEFVRKQHESDVEVGAGWVWCPMPWRKSTRRRDDR